jgi:hypothetical protein
MDGDSTAWTVATFTAFGGDFGIYNTQGQTVTLGSFTTTDNPVTGNFSPFSVTFDTSSSGLVINNDWDNSEGYNATGNWEIFGFYWVDINGNDYYTEDDMNNGNAEALVYNVLSGTDVDIDYYWSDQSHNVGETSDGDNDWIIAFDNNGNNDFNDGVFYVRDMKPVPEPATMLLLGFGLIGVGVASRKKLFKK